MANPGRRLTKLTMLTGALQLSALAVSGVMPSVVSPASATMVGNAAASAAARTVLATSSPAAGTPRTLSGNPQRGASRDRSPAKERSSGIVGGRPNPLGDKVAILGDEALDEMRGGFEMDNGLRVSFGIERAVLINGRLVTTETFNIADLRNASGGHAARAGALTPPTSTTLSVIQNGPGNSAELARNAGLAGTVIQNTLDNQKIQNVTVINSTVNSGAILRSMNVHSAVRDGIVGSQRR